MERVPDLGADPPTPDPQGMDPSGPSSPQGENTHRDQRSHTGASPRSTALELAAKIEEILDSAESSAAAIQQEAEAEAQRYVHQRRLEADRYLEERRRGADATLAERAQTLKRASAVLREAAERVLEESRRFERAIGEAPVPGGSEEEVELNPSRASSAPDGKDAAGVPEAALLRAAQMAIRGSRREEIEQTLITEFGAESPGDIVDQIFGGPRA